MVFGLINYVIKTLAKEIIEDVKIVREVLDYHAWQGKQRYLQHNKKRKLRKRLSKCQNYAQWYRSAQQFDNVQDIKEWKDKLPSKNYDYKYIQFLRDLLAEARAKKDLDKIIHTIRSHSFRNIANILNPILYRQSYIGTKTLIEQFMTEWEVCLRLIAECELPITQKLEFFMETRHAVGRTALILSGGGMMGMYHIGVVKVLYEQNLLPKIIAGASAGSIVAAFICVQKLSELQHVWDSDSWKFNAFKKISSNGQWWRRLQRFLAQGVLLDIATVKEFMQDNIGDITFQEAYDRTGLILNITVTAYDVNNQDRILNYLTAPDVCIWSAVCCSCGVPHIYGPSDLYSKNQFGQVQKYFPMGMRFLDGTFSADVPINRLSEFFNVNSFIVSQTNPYLVPLQDFSENIRYKNTFLLKLILFAEKIKKLAGLELVHRVSQFAQLGLLPRRSNKYVRLLTQSYTGSITIMPVPALKDYNNILNFPKSREELSHYITNGQKRTFAHIPYIEAYSRFERTLEECLKHVQRQQDRLSTEPSLLPHCVNEMEFDDDACTLDAGADEARAEDNLFLRKQEQGQETHKDNILPLPRRKRSGSAQARFSKVVKGRARDMRNYSFVIPRSDSKEFLAQVAKLGYAKRTAVPQEQNSSQSPLRGAYTSGSLYAQRVKALDSYV